MDPPVLARAELIQLARQTLSLSARDAGEVLDNLIQAISHFLGRGEEIQLANLGGLSVKLTARRRGRNPKTGAFAIVPAQKRIAFSPSPILRKKLLAYFLAKSTSVDGPTTQT
ncbi:MAG: HU family DNA-binding protein [Deltaproteobacteria bacterium]|jgi:nucleoid DNA-binding protein|nr:HU family DNA-binding protein [Deltaproteobacteria bacterium]